MVAKGKTKNLLQAHSLAIRVTFSTYASAYDGNHGSTVKVLWVFQKDKSTYNSSTKVHQNYTSGSVHDSTNHDGAVRILVGRSYLPNIIYIIYLHNAAQFFPYQECNNQAANHISIMFHSQHNSWR